MKGIATYVTGLALVCCGLAVVVRGQRNDRAPEKWIAEASMRSPRSGACSALLQDGRVLISGGSQQSGVLSSAELFDAGSFSSAASMSIGRSRHACAALDDGTVLAAGGDTGAGVAASAEVYSPATRSWTLVRPMAAARAGATASLLKDGRVLIAGGEASGAALATLEIYDPASREFSSVSTSLSSPRKEHAAALLADGHVMIAGGTDGSGVLDSIDMYDPATGAVAPAGKLSTPRAGLSMTRLLDGKILIAGGFNSSADLASAEVFDPENGTFTGVGPMSTPRRDHLSFRLPDNNQVLIVGGTSAGAALSVAELYVPWKKAFVSTGSLLTARAGAVGSPLKNRGRLVMAGGISEQGTSTTAETLDFATITTGQSRYRPGQRVTITGTGWVPGETVSLQTGPDSQWTVAADAAGQFTDSSFQMPQDDSGAKYYLTANGSKSAALAPLNNSGIDRQYAVTITPSTVPANTTTTYTLVITNDLLTGQSNTIQQIVITVPTGFTFTGAGAVTAPPFWTVTSVAGQAITLTTPNGGAPVAPGQAVTITVTATSPTPVGGNCGDPSTYPSYTWAIAVSQTIQIGGGGNDFSLLYTPATVTVPPANCVTFTKLVLNSVLPDAVMTGSAGPIAFNATLTRTDTNAAIANETVTFTVGAEIAGTATTNGSGVATLSYNPSSLLAGSYAVQGKFAGDQSTLPLPLGSANSNTLSFAVNPHGTGLAVADASGTVGGSVSLLATLTSDAGATLVSGRTISFTLNGVSVGSATTNASGIAALTATIPVSIAAGIYPGGVIASFASDGTYSAASGSAQLTVLKLSQTITFGPLANRTFGDAPFTVSATASSGLPVTFTASGACTVSGATVTLTGAGSCTITASQAGDASYSAATPVPQSFTIGAGAATITLGNLTQTYTGSPLSPSATTNPLGLSFTWTNAPQTNAGSYSVTATITDSNYTGSANGTFVISKATATVALGSLTQTYTGSPLTPTATTTPSGLTVTGTGAPDTNAGSYPVTANISDSNYTGSASGTFTITKAAATVALDNLTQTYTGSALTPTATTSPAGLTVTWTGAPDTNAGSYPVTATISDPNYSGSASGTFTINKAAATVTLGSLTQIYTGSALSPTATTTPVGLAVTWTGAPDTNAGSYPVTATISDPNYSGSASGTFAINKAAAAVALDNLTQTYIGSALTPTATTTPVGLAVTWTGAPDTNAGSYPVTATISDPNYTGSASGTFIINKATATVTLGSLTQTYTGSPLTPTATTTPVGLTVVWTGAPDTAAGSYPVTATIADANYTGSASGTFTINKAAATVTLGSLTQTYTGSPLTPTATTAPAGLTVTWTGAPDTAAGSYPVTATITDANYTGSASGTFTISKAVSTVTLGSMTQTYTGGALSPTVSTTPAGLATSLTGAPDTAAGSYPVTATVTDPNYTGSASGTFTISKAVATVTLVSMTQTYTGGALSPTVTTTPGGLSFSLTGAPDTNPGVYPVTATVTDANYTGSASGTFTINKAAATVTLGNLTQTYTGSPLTPTATTSPAGLSIVWTNAPQTNAGSYAVTATISDAIYAGSASGTFTIDKAAATVTLGSLMQTYTGSPLTPTASTSPAGLAVTWSGAPDTNAGSYPVTATISDPNYAGSASGTFTINKAVATVTLGNLVQTYTGSPLTPGASTSPAGLALTWTGAPDTNAGSFPVTATITNPNYTGSASDTFVVNKAVATVTLSNLTQTYTGSPLTPSASTTPSGLAITWTGAPDTSPGVYPVTATINNANYTGSANGTFTIRRPTQTIYNGALNGSYSDCGVAVSGTLLDITDPLHPQPIVGQPLTVGVGVQSTSAMTTAPLGSASAVLSPLTQDPGQVQAYANFAGTATLAPSSDTKTYTILQDPNGGPQTGQPLYTGSLFFWTTSSSSSTATLTLSATVKDGGACPGDIRKAKITFAIRNSAGGYTALPSAQNLPVGLVNPNDTTVGTATAITQHDIGNNNVQSVEIAVIVGGNYYLNKVSDDSLITISKPGLASTMAGAAELDLTAYPPSSGYLATAPLSGPDNYLKFVSNVSYNKSGTNPQGSVTVLFNSMNKPDGSVDSVMHTYLIKSSSISELTLQGHGQMSFGAKAVIQDVTNPASPISVDGGATLQVTVTDGSPGQIAISVQKKSGGMWLSSAWDGVKTVQKAVVAGDIVAF